MGNRLFESLWATLIQQIREKFLEMRSVTESTRVSTLRHDVKSVGETNGTLRL